MKNILIIIGILLMAGIASAEGTSYVYANRQRVAKVNESGVFYFHSDHLGSTSAITDEDGKVMEEQVNLPFGETISGSEKYGFTGKEQDETGLQYFGARYYDPSTGKFSTVDSAKDGVNWFVYATNNPLKFIDPDGRKVYAIIDYKLWKDRVENINFKPRLKRVQGNLYEVKKGSMEGFSTLEEKIESNKNYYIIFTRSMVAEDDRRGYFGSVLLGKYKARSDLDQFKEFGLTLKYLVLNPDGNPSHYEEIPEDAHGVVFLDIHDWDEVEHIGMKNVHVADSPISPSIVLLHEFIELNLKELKREDSHDKAVELVNKYRKDKGYPIREDQGLVTEVDDGKGYTRYTFYFSNEVLVRFPYEKVNSHWFYPTSEWKVGSDI